MGKGIDAARDDAPEHAAVMDEFKDQFVIVALKRLRDKYGDNLVFPLAEVDDTGQDLVAFSIDEQKNFHFELEKKS